MWNTHQLSQVTVLLSLKPSLLPSMPCWVFLSTSLCLSVPFIVKSHFQCCILLFLFKLICPRTSGRKNTCTSGGDDPATKLGTLPQRSYCWLLLQSHYCAKLCSWATGTISEVFDRSSFNGDALLYVMNFRLHSNPSNTFDVWRLCHSNALCKNVD